MYILAGRKKLEQVQKQELPALIQKAETSGLAEDAQAAKDLEGLCQRFEKKLHDLDLTRMISIQTAPQIRLVQDVYKRQFHVINIDGHDFDQIASALAEARATKGMPTAIIAKTVKGKGVSFMENQASWHGTAPNDEQYKVAMEDLEKVGEALCQK